jgi:23S rRNA (guanosine2251-2'-O)-methyltransferase
MSLIFGIHSVLECLKQNPGLIERLYVARGASSRPLQQIIDLARQAGLPPKFESRTVLDHKSNKASHQGVVAVCKDRQYVSFDELLENLSSQTILVILDGIEDPRNLGAILRTCAAFSVTGIILPKDHAVGISPVVSKTAEGALEYLGIARVTNLTRSIQTLKEKGVWVVGIESDQDKLCHEFDYCGPSALVFGNEGTGLRRLVRENCDVLLSIPATGAIRSLNVSVAVGIALYECTRRRLIGQNERESEGSTAGSFDGRREMKL